MASPIRLGELQLAILQVLWRRGEASAAEVHEALAARGLAPTTIATMLRKMEARRIVAHRQTGRTFVWRARVERERVHRSMVGDLIERLFGGDPKALVDHLVAEGDLDLGELDALRKKLAEHDDRAPRGTGDVR